MEFLKGNKYTILFWSILLLNVALFLIWPLAHTIALRKLLLLLAGIAGVVLLIKFKYRFEILKQPWLILMVALFGWVDIHAAFISQNGNEAWRELLGQWVPVYIAILAGIGMGLSATKVDESWFAWLLLVCALALPGFYLVENFIKWMQVGYLPIGYMLPGEPNNVQAGTDLKMSLTFSLEMLVPFSCVKLLEFWKRTGKFTLRSVWVLPLVLALAVASISLIKNFMVLLAISVILTLLVQGLRSGFLNMQRMLLGVVGLVLLSVFVVNSSITIHKFWQRSVSDTRIAWDIDHYQNWKNFVKFGLPQNVYGETLSETYYLRLAYAHAGFRDALENPLGYGVTRKAMERIEQQKDPEVSLANAHNGYLNLSCAVGMPAVILLVLTMTAVFRKLKQSSSKWATPAIWMTGFYLLHWAMDPLERDHFFEMFLYVISLMLTLVLLDKKKHE